MNSLLAASRFGMPDGTRQTSPKSPSKPKPSAPSPSGSDASAAAKAIDRLNPCLLTAEEYRRIISQMPLRSVDDVAAMLQQGARTVRRHMKGHSRIDGSTTIVMRLLDREIVTIEDVINAASP
jgi:hypothetical protein